MCTLFLADMEGDMLAGYAAGESSGSHPSFLDHLEKYASEAGKDVIDSIPDAVNALIGLFHKSPRAPTPGVATPLSFGEGGGPAHGGPGAEVDLDQHLAAAALEVSRMSEGHYAQLMKEVLSPDISTQQLEYWLNLHKAVRPAPPIFAFGTALSAFRFIAWSGYTEASYTVGNNISRRICINPYQQDSLWTAYEGGLSTGLFGPNQAGPPALTSVESASEYPHILATDGYSADGTLHVGPQLTVITPAPAYFATSMAQDGFSSTYALTPNTAQATETINMQPQACEFSGAFIAVKVEVANGASANITGIGQNQVRGLGIMSLHETVKGGGATGAPLSYDFVSDITCALANIMDGNNLDFYVSNAASLLGNLDALVPYQQITSGGQSVETYYLAVPVVPPASNIIYLTAAATDASIFLRDISTYTDEPMYNGVLNPAWGVPTLGSVPLGINFGATQYTQRNYTRRRIIRSANSPAQSMMAGFPQVEIQKTNALGTVQVTVTGNALFNMLLQGTEQRWSGAEYTARRTGEAAEKLRPFCGASVGYSRNSLDHAVQDSKNGVLQKMVASGVSTVVTKVIKTLQDRHDNKMVKANSSVSPPITQKESRFIDQVLAGGKLLASAGLKRIRDKSSEDARLKKLKL